jgi:UDP-N-acetylglucosamine diphosphorylase / glucose-1-phosphate thymidylyltransferase / UDP-N-acetylgalactosamine diphosphorylase / glucosamine-1-phosphate N-acetyltransferase / galactosamine-1-phosphate N-acetyltransferase
MSAVYLYDDARARRFEPFALTRPAGELRAGALLVRERWSRALGAPVAGHLTSPHLAGFEEPGAASVVTGGAVPSGAWVVNARYLPALTRLPVEDALLVDGERVVAVRLREALPAAEFSDGDVDLASLVPAAGMRKSLELGWWADDVWDYVRHLVPMLEHDIPVLGAGLSGELPIGAIRIGEHPIFIEAGAEVEPAVCFDASAGPILLRARSHAHAFTRLVGPLYVGEGSSVTTDRIAASSIGDICKVHGELSNTILTGHSNKGHDGFVGHSVLGRWVNLGAGTITSNLKNTYGSVHLWTPDGVRETGMQFLGTLFGDHAKTGIGVTLTTGTVLGAAANVYGCVMPPKAVAPFAWGEAGNFVDFRADKFLDVAERMMARRHVTLSEPMRQQLLASYAARWKAS